MTHPQGRAVGVCIVGLGLLALVISAPASDQPPDFGDQAAEQMRAITGDRMPQAAFSAYGVADSWGPAARRAAQEIMAKYGQPDEISDGRLVWNNTGPFRRTIVYREELAHDFPAPHADVLEQFVDYRVAPEKHADLARFDGSIRADRTSGFLSARGASEGDNIVTLNLAHEVITGKRTVESARKARARAGALALSGKTTPLARGLAFKTGARSAADPDKPQK